MSNFENNKTDAFGDSTTQQPAGSGFGGAELGRRPSDNEYDTQKLGSTGNTGTFGSSDQYDTQKLGGNTGTGTGTFGSTDEYGSQQLGGNTGTSGLDSLSSGALGETHGHSGSSSGYGTGKKESGLSGLTPNDPYGGGGADPALSTTAVAGDDVPTTTSTSHTGGRVSDSGFDDAAGLGGLNAGTNAGYGTQTGGGGAGYTGGKTDNGGFLDTAASATTAGGSGGTGGVLAGAGHDHNNNNHNGHNNHNTSSGAKAGGDSAVGKIMQKTGAVLHNAKLEEKGLLKREEKGATGADVASSATAGDKKY